MSLWRRSAWCAVEGEGEGEEVGVVLKCHRIEVKTVERRGSES